MKLLLVEDDQPLGLSLQALLDEHGYLTTWVRSAEDARRFIASEAFDLLLFDIVLPGESGLSLLQWTRQRGADAAILMLTARDAVNDRVMGLDSGADDYLPKPFAVEELLSRLRALARRRASQQTSTWRLGPLHIDTQRRRVAVNEQAVNLSKREYDLLVALATAAGKVLTRAQLAHATRSMDVGEPIESNAIDVHVYSLRKKIGGELITTVRGVGYMIDEPR
jgi:DNA-binding response OmpR family regulator